MANQSVLCEVCSEPAEATVTVKFWESPGWLQAALCRGCVIATTAHAGYLGDTVVLSSLELHDEGLTADADLA